MPNRSASRASGFINPAEGLSFSGAAVVVQQQVSALKQTSDSASFQDTSTSTSNQSFSAGLLATNDPSQPGFSAGLLSPLNSSGGSVASSLSAENDSTDLEALLRLSDCDPTVSDKYCVYTIQPGDTLSSIADRFGLTHGDFENWQFLVHSNNSVVVDPDDVSPGLKLIIPRGNGTIHTVGPSQTLTDIAEVYGVGVEDITAVPENGLSDADDVAVGTELFIPNPQHFRTPVITDDYVAPSGDSSSDSSSGGGGSAGPSITGGGPSSSAGFIWPAGGPISSYYGPNHPLGIDIDLFNNSGAPISAAMGGVVTFAGGNPCCSYGYYVVIDHGNGYQTLYAHLSSIAVSVGQVVAQGQYLGAGGSTGYSTGDHLHFEVHVNGSIVNPLNYLP